MTSTTLHTESATRTASPATDHRRTQRADTAQDALTARPEGTRPPRVPDQTAAVPTGLRDQYTVQASTGLPRGYQRVWANTLALLGLAGVAGAGWMAAVLGEFDFIRAFITQSTGFITYSTAGPAYTPSVDGFLGLAFTGPYGAIFAASLGICACLGVLALRIARRSPSLVGKALPLGAALLLPLLVVNYTILLAVEMAGAYWMPASLLENPSRLGAWMAAALIGAAAVGLTSNGLVLRWAWRREQRLAAA